MQKSLFTVFEIGFTALAVLFLALWKKFCVNLRYRCQDTDENVYSLALKTANAVKRVSKTANKGLGPYLGKVRPIDAK